VGLQSDQIRQGRNGLALEAHNNYLTSLYDPRSIAQVTVDILGDPDYLFQEPSFSENAIYSPIYSSTKPFNINPTGGQVFFEIDFKEAVDYTSQTGTLSINDSILFWKYPNGISKKIKGISYMLWQVDSKFSSGSFTQQLTGQVNTFPDPGATPSAEGREQGEAGAASATSPPADTSNQTPAAGTTPTGQNGAPVRNDDAGG
jgi:hypothetical protein